ncbi:hypothetical protein BS78_10G170500 [Paspalum vaginatum]|nr:hypothetical protein BS78_10G170500 [Paspalum vaginatum]
MASPSHSSPLSCLFSRLHPPSMVKEMAQIQVSPESAAGAPDVAVPRQPAPDRRVAAPGPMRARQEAWAGHAAASGLSADGGRVVTGGGEGRETHDVHCCSGPAMAGPRRLTYGYKDVAFAPYGDHVRNMRKLFVLELLSMRGVQAAWNAREAQVDKLIENLTRVALHPVSLDEHIFNAVDGIIGTVVFGEIYGTEHFKLQFVGMLNEAMDTLGSFSAEDFFPNAAGRFVDHLTGLVARRDRIFRRLDAFFDEVIDQHLNPTSNMLGEGSSR